MIRIERWSVGLAMLLLMGCAPGTAPVKQNVRLDIVSTAGDDGIADVDRVLDGVRMVNAGHVQAAIDGPFDAVAHRYESQYANNKQKIYSARFMSDAVLYSGLGMSAKPPVSTTVVGPAWAMAYWGRGYAYNEMARYDNAIEQLQKALALAPYDTTYNNEIGYSYQQKRQWQLSLDHYKTAEAFAQLTGPPTEVPNLTCKALRGQGYDLVEMHQYELSRAAYRACLKLIPNEPISLGEMKYVDQQEAKQRSGT